MGDAQSAQRGEKKDAAAEEESGKVDDAQEENIEEKVSFYFPEIPIVDIRQASPITFTDKLIYAFPCY